MTILNYDDCVRAKAAPWANSVEVAVFGRLNNGDTRVASVQWETIADNAAMRPLLTMRVEQAQVLMDDLWNAGVRPTEGAGSAGAMRAAQAHIADLRLVAFKALGIEGTSE
jgi:hypothetical protein